jgi:predicted  nucleic acid-binding Zn-ribbon protein
MATQLDTIVALNQALVELAQAEAALAGVPDWMRELHSEHSARLAEIKALEEAANTASGERRAAEVAVADTQEKLKHYQQQMSLVTTQREYGALLKEIDTTKAAVAKLEADALSALERVESARKALGEQQAAFAELDTRYQAEMVRWEQEKPAIGARAAALRAQAAQLREALPRAAFAHYERLRGRLGGDPLAAVKKVERTSATGPTMHSCGACNYRVRPQVLVEIRNGRELVQCESCKRILYVPAEG